jgi:hypothetical protein
MNNLEPHKKAVAVAVAVAVGSKQSVEGDLIV